MLRAVCDPAQYQPLEHACSHDNGRHRQGIVEWKSPQGQDNRNQRTGDDAARIPVSRPSKPEDCRANIQRTDKENCDCCPSAEAKRRRVPLRRRPKSPAHPTSWLLARNSIGRQKFCTSAPADSRRKRTSRDIHLHFTRARAFAGRLRARSPETKVHYRGNQRAPQDYTSITKPCRPAC